MALELDTLALGSAALSSGARIAAAQVSGPALPERLMPANDVLIETGQVINSLHFGADSASLIFGFTNNLRKIDLAGSTAWTAAVSGGVGSWRKDASTIILARSTSTNAWHQVAEADGGVTAGPLLAHSTTRRRLVSLPDSDLLWDYRTSGTLTEYSYATGSATGRTLVLPTTPVDVQVSAADGVPGIYASFATELRKYRLSDLALEKTWSLTNTTGITVPGFASLWEFVIDSVGRPIIKTTGGDLDRLNVAGGDMTLVAERLVWGGTEARGAALAPTGGGAQLKTSIALSPDGTKLAFTTADAAHTGPNVAIRVVQLDTARARWTWSPSATTTLRRIVLDGMVANQVGNASGYRSGEAQEWRRTRVYYQRATSDVSRVEVRPGEALAVPVAGSQSVTIDVEFPSPIGSPSGPWPWVSEVAVAYDAAVVDPSVPSFPPNTNGTTMTAIRDAYNTLLRALTPAKLSRRKFDHVADLDLEEWQDRPTAELLRKFAWLRGSELRETGVFAVDLREVVETATLTVVYPLLPDLYGRDRFDDLEAIIREDARQIRDALFSPYNYLGGQLHCDVIIAETERGPGLYVQRFELTVTYYEAQRLY
jgi:hypothetical protein